MTNSVGWAEPKVDDVFGPAPEGSDPLLHELAEVALECATAAGVILREALAGGAREVETKTSATDMVSAADVAAEAMVAALLAERRPDDGILGEEGTSREGTTGIRWVVDPLDGTTNFLFGIPQFAVSVAAELDGVTTAGVVLDPSRGEIWAAVRGWGGRCNGRLCKVAAGRSSIDTALIATGFGYMPSRREWQGEIAGRLLPRVRDIRRFGAASLDLSWTAGGRYDAYYEWGLNPWDLAAGALVCSEAGARVEAFPGRLIVACPQELFGPLTELLEEVGATDIPAGPEPAFW